MQNAVLIMLTVIMITLSSKAAHAFCFDKAGSRYGISPDLLHAICKGESSFNPTAVNYNSNGTYDYGLMQINSSWEPKLRKLGISWESLSDPCTNVMVGAWVLSQCIQDYGYTWSAVGCYNSRTPTKRDRYAARIAKIVKQGPYIQRQTTIGAATTFALSSPWEETFGTITR